MIEYYHKVMQQNRHKTPGSISSRIEISDFREENTLNSFPNRVAEIANRITHKEGTNDNIAARGHNLILRSLS